MSNVDIAKYGYKAVRSDEFNALPDSDKRHGVILNLDNKGPGTHWTAIIEDSPHKYKYFDSFGAQPPYVNGLVYYNTTQVQGNNETNCGQRSINFLDHINKAI